MPKPVVYVVVESVLYNTVWLGFLLSVVVAHMMHASNYNLLLNCGTLITFINRLSDLKVSKHLT